jgi:hypothetical protein
MTDPEVADEDDGAHPWETSPQLRRDLPPHRGYLLKTIATIVVLLSAVTGPCFFLAFFLAIPPALLLWWAAANDLARIRTGRMDPHGQKETAEARTCALVSLALPFLGLLLWGLLFAIVGLVKLLTA